MNPIGHTRHGALPQVRVPDCRSLPMGGSTVGKAAVVGGAAVQAGATVNGAPAGADEMPRLRRISGSRGANQDALLRYGSAAQIRSSSAAGSQIDVYV